MNPLEYIEEGIREGNWETVCKGYERLTGEALPIPKTVVMTDGVEDALRQIADIVSSTLDGPIAEIYEEPAKPAKRKLGRPNGSGKKNTKKTTKKKTKKRTTVNKDGEDSSLQLDEGNKTVVQKTTGNAQLITNEPDPEEVKANKVRAAKVGRKKLKVSRQTTNTYEVQCNECEKSFQSNRPQGEMGQKCPKCLRGLKGRF